jgi:hypothetical protein
MLGCCDKEEEGEEVGMISAFGLNKIGSFWKLFS